MKGHTLLQKVKKIPSGLKRRTRSFLKTWTQQPSNHINFDTIHLHFFKPEQDIVIFDIGAHVGESVNRFRTIFSRSTVHSFEPDLENYQNLCRNLEGQSNLHLNNCGVGSEAGQSKFFRNRKTNTSGFHPVNLDSEWLAQKSKIHNVSKEDFTEKSYNVEVIALDDYLETSNIDRINIMKIDTQGFEDEVLKGCYNALKEQKIDVIETELIVGNPYKKSLSFYDIESLLSSHGYKFYALSNGGDLLKTPSLCFDLLYVREGLLK